MNSDDSGDRRLAWWVLRVTASVAVAQLAGCALAVLEVYWASHPAASELSRGRLIFADAGLLVLLAAPLGAGVGLFCAFLHAGPPADAAKPRTGAASSPPALGWAAIVFAAVTSLAVVLVAQLAFRVLADPGPAFPTGAGLAVVTVLVAFPVALLAPGLSARLARQQALGSRAGIAIALAIAAGALAFGIVTGTPNGGGNVFGILGVLKREELDLRPVFLLAVLSAAAYAAASRPGWLPSPVWAAALLLPWGATAYAAFGGLSDTEHSVALERGAPVGGRVLGLAREATDRDGDGVSGWFGGGDCDDANPNVFPGADDEPGNGIDEDCSGQDDRAVVLEPDTPLEPENARDWIRKRVPDAPGVVLITVDTLHYRLGFTGYERPISPNIDALAKKGVVLERAYALASYTGKSVGPMLIGKYPSETHRNWGHFNKFSEEDTFVQERLQKAGIRTLSVQGHWYFKADSGLGRGFDVDDHSAAPRVPQMEGDTTVNSDDLTDAAIGLLSDPENTQGAFFLWVHYLDPHAMYMHHEAFDFGRKGRDLYDSEVAFVDQHVGRLLDFIEGQDFAARTAVILTSDHGEAFGEHGIYRHGRELWEEMIRVPWVFHLPGATPRRVSPRRSAIDLVPTLLDFYGLPIPNGEGDFVSGQSLLADLYGPPGHEAKSRIVFVDMAAGPYNAERQAFIDHDMKLVATDGRPLSLFDLAEDPGEQENLLKEEERLEPVLARFKAFRRQLRVVKVGPP